MRAIFGKRPARLAHEPHRRPLDFLAPGGAHEKRLAHATRVAPIVHRVGEHPVTAGPLAPRWLAWSLGPARAGVSSTARVALENAGTATWRSQRDGRRPGVVSLARPAREPDRLGRPAHAASASGCPGGAGRARARRHGPAAARPVPARVRPRRGAPILVRGGRREPARDRRRRRARGSPSARSRSACTAARIPRRRPRSRRRTSPSSRADGVAVAHLVAGAVPPPDWSRVLLDAHEEGWAAVGTAVASTGRDRMLDPWRGGGGRNPRFDEPAPPPLAARRDRAVRHTSGCRPTTGTTACSTEGSWSHFRGDPVVDRPEHQGAERERDRRSRRRGRRGSPPRESRPRRAAPGSTRREASADCPTGSGRRATGSCRRRAGCRGCRGSASGRRAAAGAPRRRTRCRGRSHCADATASERPETKSTITAAIGIASHAVARDSGSTIIASTSTIAVITAKATSCVATIESGTSCRGKRTLRIRLAFSSRLRADDCSDVEKKTQGGSPQSRNSQ